MSLQPLLTLLTLQNIPRTPQLDNYYTRIQRKLNTTHDTAIALALYLANKNSNNNNNNNNARNEKQYTIEDVARITNTDVKALKKLTWSARKLLEIEYSITQISKVYQTTYQGIEDHVKQIIALFCKSDTDKQQQAYHAAIFYSVLTSVYRYKLPKQDFITRFDINPNTFDPALVQLKKDHHFALLLKKSQASLKVKAKPVADQDSKSTEVMAKTLVDDPNVAFYGKFCKSKADIPIALRKGASQEMEVEESEEFIKWKTRILLECDKLIPNQIDEEEE